MLGASPRCIDLFVTNVEYSQSHSSASATPTDCSLPEKQRQLIGRCRCQTGFTGDQCGQQCRMENVALRKRVTMSSVATPGDSTSSNGCCAGANCVDGDIRQPAEGSFYGCHTAYDSHGVGPEHGRAWLMIDLANSYTITSVVVYGRGGYLGMPRETSGVVRACASRDCTDSTQLAHHNIVTSGITYTWTLNTPQSGVHFVMVQQTHGRIDPMNLAEVQVFGFEC